MLGFAPIAAAPIGEAGAVNFSFSGAYNGNAIIVPNASMFEDETFAAPNVFTGSVRIDSGIYTEGFIFTVSAIDAGAVDIDQGVFTQNYVFSANELVTGSPVIDNATYFENYDCVAANLSTQNPTIENASVTISNNFSASGIVSNPPVIDAAVTVIDYNAQASNNITEAFDVGLARFPFMEISVPAETWTDIPEISEIWTDAA
tara:strand:- start:1102 stop:1710 length:609 start_codon:yes stop_codon:yes gene_type:complete